MSSIELPVLRLGLAGFSATGHEQMARALQTLSAKNVGTWQIAAFADADVWWVNGARAQRLDDGILRVASGVPSGRSLHLNLGEIDRPIAFAEPITHRELAPPRRFDPKSTESMARVLRQFEVWLRPTIAQFGLASQILEHETVLGSGVYHVSTLTQLLAVVNLRGEVAVLGTATPADFEGAMWTAQLAGPIVAPESFVRTSVSQLMWRYALRTTRDVLPARYRKGLLYFRRPPRLPQRMLRDSHLLLLRELALEPATFDQLVRRTAMRPELLARELAALYLVGAITSNPKRACAGAFGRGEPASSDSAASGVPHSVEPEDVPGAPGMVARLRNVRPDLTVPAPLSFE